MRSQIVKTLRDLADRLESENCSLDGNDIVPIEYIAVTPDDMEFHNQEFAQKTAESYIEWQDAGIWPDDVDSVSWGMYVPIEIVVEVSRVVVEGKNYDEEVEYELCPMTTLEVRKPVTN